MQNIPALPKAPRVSLARDGYIVTRGVFVSSTCRDLADVREEAIKTIGHNLCVPVAMELWRADQQKAETLCFEQLRDKSSHYVGIIGFRRGYVPDLLRGQLNAQHKSITEAEYDWAVQLQKTIALFLPRVGSGFYDELKKNASSDPSEKEELVAAQEAFYLRLHRDTVNLIDGRFDVAAAIGAVLGQWRADLSLRVQESDLTPPPTPPVFKIGRSAQMSALAPLMTKSHGGQIACVVIHGQRHMGHEQMVMRFKSALVNPAGSTKFASVVVSASCALGNLDWLVDTLSTSLFGTSVTVLSEFAVQLSKALQHHDIFLNIADADEYEGGFPVWIQTFWQPLLTMLTPLPPKRLFILVTIRRPVDPASKSEVFDASSSTVEMFSPSKPLLLPELKPFTESELVRWLSDHCDLPEMVALQRASTLLAKTQGEPEDIYERLSASPKHS